MFFELMKKELKVYFSNKVNWAFVVVIPLLFIGLFSVALKDYIGADYGTFDDGKEFYYLNVEDGKYVDRLNVIIERLTEATGVCFERVYDIEQAKKDVEKSKAYGVITVNADGYDYYRSPYNETEGGKLIRTMFVEMAQNEIENIKNYPIVVSNNIEVKVSDVDSYAYYTFTALAFTLMMLSVGVSLSIYDEREHQTIIRYRISKGGIWGMLGLKIVVGMIAGALQLLISFTFSTVVLGVKWGDKIGWMLLLLLLHNTFAILMAIVLGLKGKNKAISQDMVFLITMLSAYLGGSVTPVYLLENIPVLKLLVKISPLYWTNQALISLYNDIFDKKTLYSALISIGLAFIMFLLIAVGEKKKHVVMIVKETDDKKDKKEEVAA